MIAMAFTLASGATPAKQQQTAVQELFLHRRFINSYALLYVEICNYYRSCVVNGRTGKRIPT